MTAQNPVLMEMNRRHDAFWKDEREHRDRRILDPTLYRLAIADMSAEANRVPMKNQKSLELALKHAENAKKTVLGLFARKGGQAEKRDALQMLIETIVRAKPLITSPQLLAELQSRQVARDVIDDIDDRTIFFLNSQGRLKRAKIAGLKDRLSRAKKDINSR